MDALDEFVDSDVVARDLALGERRARFLGPAYVGPLVYLARNSSSRCSPSSVRASSIPASRY